MIGTLVENSLGIYLIHPFVLAVLQHCNVDALFFAPTVLSVPTVALLTFLLSWFAATILRICPIFEKYLC